MSSHWTINRGDWELVDAQGTLVAKVSLARQGYMVRAYVAGKFAKLAERYDSSEEARDAADVYVKTGKLPAGRQVQRDRPTGSEDLDAHAREPN